jgi:hypothetical protein
MGDLRVIDHQPAHPDLLPDLERYWQSLRPGAGVPDRSTVDPARIDHALPHAFILERIAPGTARVRVSGQRMNDYLGMDLRGMPICTLFTAAARESFQGWLEQVFALPALVDLPLTSRWSLGQPRLTGRMLLLPLADSAGKVTRALGAVRTEGIPGRLPRAFDISDGVRIRNLADLPHGPAVRRLRSVQAAVPLAGERPWLKLVVSNG